MDDKSVYLCDSIDGAIVVATLVIISAARVIKETAGHNNETSMCYRTLTDSIYSTLIKRGLLDCGLDGVCDRRDFVGIEVAERTLGLIGLWRIGREVGVRMKAFEMTVIGHDLIMPAEVVTPLGIEFITLEEIWKRADCITCHVPLLPQTKYLVNKDTFAKCKDGVMISNRARGGVVNEQDLYNALVSKSVRAAALDVFEEEPPMNEDLSRHPMVYAAPQLDAITSDGQRRVGEEIVDEIIKLTKGRKKLGVMNAIKLNTDCPK